MQSTLFIMCKSKTEVEVFDLSDKDKMEKCMKDGYFHTATINPKILVKNLITEIPDSEIREILNDLISKKEISSKENYMFIDGQKYSRDKYTTEEWEKLKSLL
jgi:hypothetical protein